MTRTVESNILPGVIKWYSEKKGYGFVTTVQGDVLIHVSILRGAFPQEGGHVRVVAVQGEKGLRAESIEFTGQTALPTIDARELRYATLVYFDRQRGYGFAKMDGVDVMLHITTFQQNNIDPTSLHQGDAILIVPETRPKGLRAVHIRRPQ